MVLVDRARSQALQRRLEQMVLLPHMVERARKQVELADPDRAQTDLDARLLEPFGTQAGKAALMKEIFG